MTDGGEGPTGQVWCEACEVNGDAGEKSERLCQLGDWWAASYPCGNCSEVLDEDAEECASCDWTPNELGYVTPEGLAWMAAAYGLVLAGRMLLGAWGLLP